jgi:osmoprotectant transport system substrate-binding protein
MRRRFASVAAVAALALVLAACGGGLEEEPQGGGGDGTDKKNITVKLASNDFTEQLILADIYRQALQAGGYTVDYKAKLGPREIVAPALERGEINMYIEYAGSALVILAKKEGVKDEQQIYDQLKAYYATKGITPLQQAPMSDQNAFTVTQQTSQQRNLRSLADLTPNVAGQLVLGGPPECEQRVTCLKGVEQAYNTRFKDFRPIAQGALKYQALLNDDIQVALSFTTDGIIAKQKLVVLEDPKGVFPPDHAVPVLRNDLIQQGGQELQDLINKVSAKITTEEITALNAKVDLEREDPDAVATEWLKAQGLV